MKQRKTENENELASGGPMQAKAGPSATMAPPPFQLKADPVASSNNGTAQLQENETEGAQSETDTAAVLADAQTTPVIETTGQAFSHYFNGNGASVDIGPNSIDTLLGTEDFLTRHNRITGGLTTSLSGNFSVDMTWEVFHIGRTNVDYNVVCNGDECTVTYTLFGGDGFWDPDFIDENTLGRLGLPWFQPDGPGPNLERFGGTPYHYNTATRSFTFTNPGY